MRGGVGNIVFASGDFVLFCFFLFCFFCFFFFCFVFAFFAWYLFFDIIKINPSLLLFLRTK